VCLWHDSLPHRLRWSKTINNQQKTVTSLCKKINYLGGGVVLLTILTSSTAMAGDADINLPDLTQVTFPGVGLGGHALFIHWAGLLRSRALFGFWEYGRCRALPVHKAMSNVSNIIWETCKTYLWQQGKFLVLLWALIAACIVYYFYFLQENPSARWSHSGKFGNGHSRQLWRGVVLAFALTPTPTAAPRLRRSGANSLQTLMIPLRSGMSIGLLLVCVELVCMIGILLLHAA